jgi:hypothetical protein
MEKETQVGYSQRALPFQCAPREAREAWTFPSAPSRDVWRGHPRPRTASLAAAAKVYPEATTVGNSALIINLES